jgi:ferredoxin, 2Fe-2S
MPKVTYIEFEGKEHSINLPLGFSIMEGAIQNSIKGIDADCGGSCACATCHVYIDENWVKKLPEIQESERDMLDFVTELKNNSRLSCQITMTDQLDGIIVRLPKKQG